MLTCNGKPLICTYSDDGTVPANPDIAGVLTAFISTSILTLVAIIVGYLLGAIPRERFNRLDNVVVAALRRLVHIKGEVSEPNARARQKALERFILGLSDQQLVTGITILVTGYAQTCTIDGYHFSVLVAMAWFSSTTHLSTLVVLRDNFRARPALRLLRVVGMVWVCGMLILGEILFFVSLDYYMVVKCAFSVASLQGTDASCWQAAMMVSLYLIITYSNKITELYRDIPGGSVVELALEYIMTRKRSPLSRLDDTENKLSNIYQESKSAFGRQLRVLGTMFDFFFMELQDSFLWQIVWIISGNFYGALQLVTFRFVPPIPTVVGNDNQMVFGQLVPLLLLALPLMAAVEAYFEAQNDNAIRCQPQAATTLSVQSRPSELDTVEPRGQPYKDVVDAIVETGDQDSLQVGKVDQNPDEARHNHSPHHAKRSLEAFEMGLTPATAHHESIASSATIPQHHPISSTDTLWPLATGDLYARSNLTCVLWPMLASIALGLTGFMFLFSGFAMPQDDTLFSYTVSLVCLLPLAAAHMNSVFRAFGVGKGS